MLRQLLLKSVALCLVVATGFRLTACSDEPVGPGHGDGVADVVTEPPDAEEDALGDIGADPCHGVTCSGHGHCAASSQGATCSCDKGFVTGGGLTCVHPGQCGAGLIRVADQCAPVTALSHWCSDYCESLGLACPSGASWSDSCNPYCEQAVDQGPGCMAKCMGAMDQPGAAARTICGGLMRRIDSVDCTHLAHCAEPVDSGMCVALCAAANDCGLLLDSRLLLGGSPGECVLNCEALATALTPSHRFAAVRACLSQAMQKCDPVQMLGCTVVGVPGLDSSLCSTVAPDCGFIPDIWPDAAACDAGLQAWSPGERIAVGGCLQIGGNEALCGEHHCANPPAELPIGVLAAAHSLLKHCPQLLAAPDTYDFVAEFYAWFFIAVLKAFGQPTERNYALVSACYLSSTCPATKEGTMQCLLNTPKD